jgi:uncharacterized protein (DUF433 family)
MIGEMTMFDRITSDPKVLSGKPCIRGTRLSVEFILELFASGGSRADILNAYSQLTEDDIEQAVRYAAHGLKNEILLDVEMAQ